MTGWRNKMRLNKIANNLYKLELNVKNQIMSVVWFSYETPVAFLADRDITSDLVITKNIWSNTTGKHLNIIDKDKDKRIDNHEFIEKLNRAFNL